jgi:hypothetical protein
VDLVQKQSFEEKQSALMLPVYTFLLMSLVALLLKDYRDNWNEHGVGEIGCCRQLIE